MFKGKKKLKSKVHNRKKGRASNFIEIGKVFQKQLTCFKTVYFFIKCINSGFFLVQLFKHIIVLANASINVALRCQHPDVIGIIQLIS